MTSSSVLAESAERLRASVDRYITVERVRRYLQALTAVPAPSTASARLRGPVVETLLQEDGLLDSGRMHYVPDYEHTGNTLVLCGDDRVDKAVWYFAHMDTVSYMIHPRSSDGYPLVPFCNHLITDKPCGGIVYRYDIDSGRYHVAAEGQVGTAAGKPVFIPSQEVDLVPGDRVVFDIPYDEDGDTGTVHAHLDNAGAVAALLCAAPVLADAGVSALLALTDEEEGPTGGENQVIGRGGARLTNLLPQPELSIVGDMQQAGGIPDADTRGGVENSVRIGEGAVLTEFSSLARGAVTPPHVYVTAREYSRVLRGLGVRIQESNNAYTSRSDDVSAMLRNPNIVLLGFPGVNRHCDHGLPRANLHDIVELSKAFAYFGLMSEFLRTDGPLSEGRS